MGLLDGNGKFIFVLKAFVEKKTFLEPYFYLFNQMISLFFLNTTKY